MYQSAAQINGAKVFDPQGQLICKIRQVVIDPNNGQVLGLLTSLPKPQNILSMLDVNSWKKDYVLLEQHYEFHQTGDLVRLDHALQNHCELIGKKVKTESKQFLGYVIDYTLDLKNQVLASITVQKSFFKLIFYQGCLIQQKSILEITPRVIIVRDNTVKIPLLEELSDESTQQSPAI